MKNKKDKLDEITPKDYTVNTYGLRMEFAKINNEANLSEIVKDFETNRKSLQENAENLRKEIKNVNDLITDFNFNMKGLTLFLEEQTGTTKIKREEVDKAEKEEVKKQLVTLKSKKKKK